MTNKQRGGVRSGAGRKFKRRVLVAGGSDIFAFFRAGATSPEFTLTGCIEVDERSGVTTIVTAAGDRLVIGSDAAPPGSCRERPAAAVSVMAADALLTGDGLTDLDLQVLRAVWQYGVLTADQLGRLVFPQSAARREVERRLEWLVEEFCLNRVEPGGGGIVYTLDALGVRLIQREQPPERRITGSPPAAIGPHSPDIAEFAVRLTEAARAWPGGGGLRWYGAHLLAQVWPGEGQVNPAGLGRLRLGEATLDFFLEWDADNSPRGDRIAAYLDFMRRPAAWRGQFSRFPVVLVVASTPARVEKILVEGRRRPGDDEAVTVLVTTAEALNQQGVLSQVWRQIGATEPDDLAQRQGLSLPQVMGLAEQ